MMVEMTFFPEQLDPKHSAYEYMRDLYNQQQPQLCSLAEDYIPDDGTVPVATGDLPRFQFGDGTVFVWDEVYVPSRELQILFGDRPVVLEWPT
jgi:hypothetical protein